MTEHLTSVQVEDYRRQRLSPEDLLGADDHLAKCAECRRQVRSQLDTVAATLYSDLAGETSGDTHPTFEQTARYVDALMTGDERQMLEDHLASCAQCEPLVSDLRTFRNEIVKELDNECLPSTPVLETIRPQRVDRAGPWPRVTFARIPTWVFAAVPLLVLLAVAAWIGWKSRTIKDTEQIVLTSPTVSPSTSIDLVSPTPVIRDVASQLVRINDGDLSLTLDSQGNLAGAEKWPAEFQRMAREALIAGRVEKSSQLAGLSRPGSSLMGGDDKGQSFSAIEPAGKILFTDRPTFRWSKLTGATGYIVEVYDENFNPAVTSPLLTSNTWTASALTRGRLYSWQVKAIKEGQEYLAPRPPAPQAKFRILDQAKAGEISRARREYPSSHLVLGLLYAKAGLLEDAEKELVALQKANPDVETLGRLSASIQSARR